MNRRLGTLIILMVIALATPASQAADNDRHWVGTWSANPLTGPPAFGGISSITDATLRQVVHISFGGDIFQVRFSNEMGTTPLVIKEARIAISAGGADTVPGTSRQITFGGQTSITIPPGSPFLSDPVSLSLPYPVPLSLPPLSNVAISIYFQQTTPTSTFHELSMETTYQSTTGNFTKETSFPILAGRGGTATNFYFVTGLSVLAPKQAEAVVCFGDSITDAGGSTSNANHRWPDYLSARVRSLSSMDHLAVINSGVSANRVLTDYSAANKSALYRFDRDVVRQPGVKYVILQLGINDILGNLLNPPTPANADGIIRGYRQIIARAHEAGLKIYGTTLTPDHYQMCFGTNCTTYWNAEGEVQRKLVNEWIRTSGQFDAVIDFDKAVRDPNNPDYYLPAYDSGDHLHPSDAGAQAMANAVDLMFLKSN